MLEKIGNERMLRKSIAVTKLKFFGHVVRQDGLEREILTDKVEGGRRADHSRPRGAGQRELA